MTTAQRTRASKKTDAGAPAALSDNGMTHRAVLTALSGLLLGMFVSMLASTVVGTSLPRHHLRPRRRPVRLHLGRHRDPARHHRLDPDLGQARRPLQPQAAAAARPRDLRGRLGRRRLLAGRRDAHHDARVPGHRRRRPRRPQPDRHGRHHQPARARQVRGPLRRRHGRRHRRRPAARRRHHRQPRLALELLRRPADRDRRDRPAAAHAAPAQATEAQGHDRLPRHRAHLGRRLAAAALGHVRAASEFDWISGDRACSWSAAPPCCS